MPMNSSSARPYIVYILRCRDQSLYTGMTADMARRLDEHNRGVGAKYTRAKRPVSLAVAWTVGDRSTALRLEARLKKLSRAEKEKLILSHPTSQHLLAHFLLHERK